MLNSQEVCFLQRCNIEYMPNAVKAVMNRTSLLTYVMDFSNTKAILVLVYSVDTLNLAWFGIVTHIIYLFTLDYLRISFPQNG